MSSESTPRPGCLLVEPSEQLRTLYEYWLEDARTKSATDLESLRESMDPTIMVACVEHGILEGRRAEVLGHVFDSNLFCQVLPIVPRDGNEGRASRRYDGVLARPLNRSGLRETLKRAFTRGQFLTLVHRYYVLNARVHGPLDRGDTAESDTEEDVERLQNRLQNIEKGLDETDHRRIQRSFHIRKHLPGSVTTQERSGQSSKYRPTSCSECSTTGRIEDGESRSFSRIAAGVWVCDGCGAVVQVQTNANPWVAKR